MRLYRIDPEVAENLDYSLTGELPDPLSLFIDDGVMVPVEPCEHGRYGGHEHHKGELRDGPCTIDICDSSIHWVDCIGAGLDESRGDTE